MGSKRSVAADPPLALPISPLRDARRGEGNFAACASTSWWWGEADMGDRAVGDAGDAVLCCPVARWTLRARERTLPVRGGLAVAPISCGSPLPSERVAGASPAAAACSKSWPPGCRAAFPSAVGALEFSR
eukprot:scaffold66035_cov15-Tisochrysis_lutea.AAC.1